MVSFDGVSKMLQCSPAMENFKFRSVITYDCIIVALVVCWSDESTMPLPRIFMRVIRIHQPFGKGMASKMCAQLIMVFRVV